MRRATILLALLLTGCASQPVKVAASPFERCMTAFGTTTWYPQQRIAAADWCQANGHGGAQ